MIQLQDGIKALNERLRIEVQKKQDGLLKQSDSLHDAQAFMQVTFIAFLKRTIDLSACCEKLCTAYMPMRAITTCQVRVAMQGINLSVDSLQAAMQRVLTDVMQPYNSIRQQTSQMQNLHATADILRHVLHRLKLISKLKVGAALSICEPCA